MSNTEPITLLVVESQPLMLAMLSTVLSAGGMLVVGEVTDSRQAIRSVAQCNPQVLVFSVGLPSLPDVERIAAIRQEFPNVLILALISGDFRGQERMTLDYGAHHVLTKAASSTELIFTIKKLFQQNISSRTPLHKHKKERRAHRALDQPG